MEFRFCDTLHWIPLFHPQGDPLKVVSGPINQFYLESIFIGWRRLCLSLGHLYASLGKLYLVSLGWLRDARMEESVVIFRASLCVSRKTLVSLGRL